MHPTLVSTRKVENSFKGPRIYPDITMDDLGYLVNCFTLPKRVKMELRYHHLQVCKGRCNGAERICRNGLLGSYVFTNKVGYLENTIFELCV